MLKLPTNLAMKVLAVMLCLPALIVSLASDEEDITAMVLPSSAAKVLNASKSARCPLPCTTYYAGASESSPFVAQVFPSGIGDLGSDIKVNCYPPYGVGAPYTDDWNVCFQDNGVTTQAIPPQKSAASICEELMDEIGSIDVDNLGSSGALGKRSTPETSTGRWMKGKAGIGCGWGANMGSGLGELGVNTQAWTLEDWIANVGFQVKRWQTNVASEKACCEYAMSFEGTPWQEGGSAVRFQFSAGQCKVDRETMVRANLDRSSGLALRDTEVCGNGALYWRHATGGADAANLKGETMCQKNNGFEVLASSEGSAYLPIGSLPDHFTNQWGNEMPNHHCSNWPHGNCRGVIGYNTIASPEECCRACVHLTWVKSAGGDVSMKTRANGKQVHSNPCVAWQIVGGKCRIMREEMVREHPSFKGKTVRQAIETRAAGGAACLQQTKGDSIWSSEQNCNYYSFARYRETFNVTPPSNTIQPGLRNVSNATFSKVVLFDYLGQIQGLEEMLSDLAQNGTTQMLEIKSSILSLPGTGSSSRAATIQNSNLSAWLDVQRLEKDASTCARVRLFSSDDMMTFADGSASLQDPSLAPWCETDVCLSSGADLLLECNLTKFWLESIENRRRLHAQGMYKRRLGAVPKIAFAFDADGTGKDNIVFDGVSVSRKSVKGKPSAVATQLFQQLDSQSSTTSAFMSSTQSWTTPASASSTLSSKTPALTSSTQPSTTSFLGSLWPLVLSVLAAGCL